MYEGCWGVIEMLSVVTEAKLLSFSLCAKGCRCVKAGESVVAEGLGVILLVRVCLH